MIPCEKVTHKGKTNVDLYSSSVSRTFKPICSQGMHIKCREGYAGLHINPQNLFILKGCIQTNIYFNFLKFFIHNRPF